MLSGQNQYIPLNLIILEKPEKQSLRIYVICWSFDFIVISVTVHVITRTGFHITNVSSIVHVDFVVSIVPVLVVLVLVLVLVISVAMAVAHKTLKQKEKFDLRSESRRSDQRIAVSLIGKIYNLIVK